MKPALALVLALSLGACSAAGDARAIRAGIEAAPPTEAAAVVSALPIVQSTRDEDCGPAVLAAALRSAGVIRSLDDVRAAVFDPARAGTPSSALVRYAREQGVFALARRDWFLDDLKPWVRLGVAPLVALWAAPGRYHFVLLSGFDDARRWLLLRDQAGEELALSYDAFFPRWCDARGWALVVADPSIVLPPPPAGPDLAARELGALGWLAESRRGDLAAAARHYRAALAKDPGFEPAANNLAAVEARIGGAVLIRNDGGAPTLGAPRSR